jgi:hypothetical protein
MRLSSSSGLKQDGGPAERNDRAEAKSEDASALPAQLGRKLRALYSVEEREPASKRLAELIEELAARERTPG